jgi:hypothetical protein
MSDTTQPTPPKPHPETATTNCECFETRAWLKEGANESLSWLTEGMKGSRDWLEVGTQGMKDNLKSRLEAKSKPRRVRSKLMADETVQEFNQHLRTAQREFLLAFKSVLDTTINRLENDPPTTKEQG